MAEIVAFTVAFFSALFVSACMSTSGSVDLAVLFIAADIGQSLLELHDVRAVSKSVRELLRRQQPHSRSQLHCKSGSGTPNLVSMILAVTRDPNAFQANLMKNTRLRACLPHPVAREHTPRLEMLGASGECKHGSTHHLRPHLLFTQSASIVPAPSRQVPLSGPTTAEVTRAMNTQMKTSEDSNASVDHTQSAEKLKQVVQEFCSIGNMPPWSST